MPVPPLNFFIAKLMRLITLLSSEKAYVQIVITLKDGVPQPVSINRTYQPENLPPT